MGRLWIYLVFPFSLSISMVLTSEYLLPPPAGAEPFFFLGEEYPLPFLGEEERRRGGDGDL